MSEIGCSKCVSKNTSTEENPEEWNNTDREFAEEFY